METYVILATFTPQGSRLAGSGSGHLEDLRAHALKVGARVEAFYVTLGEYDAVAVIAAPNESAMAKLSLSLGAAGNLRTLTLPGFPEAQLHRLVLQQ